MQTYIPFILFAIGFMMIIKGSDWFVEATIWLAKVLRIPNFIIGATLVSLCTTLPETMVSSSSALKGNPDIAFGNAIGSIACNTGLILGLTLILSKPYIKDKNKLFNQGCFILVLMGFLSFVSMMTGVIDYHTGYFLLGILCIYMVFNIRASLKARHKAEDVGISVTFRRLVETLFTFVIGLGLTIWGANLLVENGEIIARLLGVPDVVIGLTLTAFGTSLPELVTAMTAVFKKASDLSIGNVLGANILNLLMVLGISSVILPIPVQTEWMSFHLPYVALLVGLVVIYSMTNKRYYSRWHGVVILATYMSYLYFTVT